MPGNVRFTIGFDRTLQSGDLSKQMMVNCLTDAGLITTPADPNNSVSSIIPVVDPFSKQVSGAIVTAPAGLQAAVEAALRTCFEGLAFDPPVFDCFDTLDVDAPTTTSSFIKCPPESVRYASSALIAFTSYRHSAGGNYHTRGQWPIKQATATTGQAADLFAETMGGSYNQLSQAVVSGDRCMVILMRATLSMGPNFGGTNDASVLDLGASPITLAKINPSDLIVGYENGLTRPVANIAPLEMTLSANTKITPSANGSGDYHAFYQWNRWWYLDEEGRVFFQRSFFTFGDATFGNMTPIPDVSRAAVSYDDAVAASPNGV